MRIKSVHRVPSVGKKKYILKVDLSPFFRPSCAGAVLYQISSQICTYISEWRNGVYGVEVFLFVLEFIVRYYPYAFPFFYYISALCFRFLFFNY